MCLQIALLKLLPHLPGVNELTHWGRVTGNLTPIGSDNGLSPGRRQAIIWSNAGILFIRPLGTNFSEILIGVQTFLFKKMELKMSSAKWRPFCLGLNVLNAEISPHWQCTFPWRVEHQWAISYNYSAQLYAHTILHWMAYSHLYMPPRVSPAVSSPYINT